MTDSGLSNRLFFLQNSRYSLFFGGFSRPRPLDAVSPALLCLLFHDLPYSISRPPRSIFPLGNSPRSRLGHSDFSRFSADILPFFSDSVTPDTPLSPGPDLRGWGCGGTVLFVAVKSAPSSCPRLIPLPSYGRFFQSRRRSRGQKGPTMTSGHSYGDHLRAALGNHRRPAMSFFTIKSGVPNLAIIQAKLLPF